MNTLQEVVVHRPIKVLIVDDSEALCKFLSKILSRDPGVEVVGYALDAYEARDKIKLLQPDVLTLDVEMPRMDGLTFLRNLMRLRPMPVVMISSLTSAGAEVTLDALDAGAVDFMVKRHPGCEKELDLYAWEIVRRVKQAGLTKMVNSGSTVVSKSSRLLDEHKNKVIGLQEATRIIAVGSSTGGPEALKHLLKDFYAPDSAMLFAQHMPDRFMSSFAARLNSWSKFNISIAKSGETVEPGRGYVAPGDHHIEVVKRSGKLQLVCCKTDLVRGHRPSVDVLFKSVAKATPQGAVGILLTGMGDDGAAGLTEMRSRGSLTVIQDENTSAVWGMPGKAYEMGGADSVLPLLKIAPSLTNLLSDVA